MPLLLIPALALVGFAGIFTKFFLYATFRQPSGSMYPAIGPGQHFSFNRLDKTPVRGAAMVFHYPERPDQDFDKRVIGLPGDTIATTTDSVSINGWTIPQCPLGDHRYHDKDDNADHAGTLAVEFLGDATYLVFYESGSLAMAFGPYLVKSGEYFVMGDNRNNSHDSRMWFGGAGGGVPFDLTVGRVRLSGLTLPPGAESLKPALDACLAKRPAKTLP